MRRLLIVLTSLLVTLGVTSTARAEGTALAAGPALGGESVMALTLLDGWRAQADGQPVHRVRLPQKSRQAEREQPGELLTAYVERVWSQARVYRRPGGAEVILRAKF